MKLNVSTFSSMEDYWQARAKQVETALSELMVELEAAEKDAARYRWLRNQSDCIQDAEIDVCKRRDYDNYSPLTSMLDDAIDAAMEIKP